MHNRWTLRLHSLVFSTRHLWTEELLALLLLLFIFVAPASATRLQERSLLMYSVDPGVSTTYKLSFRYVSPDPVGSVNLLFCMSPIPDDPCVPPPGLDVSGATLAEQTGETGFSISPQSSNHMVLTRTPGVVTSAGSTYTFTNVLNPTVIDQAFALRMTTHDTTDASGPHIDFGSLRAQVTSGIVIETQVPPMLVFCMAEEVAEDCSSTNDNFYTHMGQLDPLNPVIAQTQMAVGTNASGGFVITANGTPLAARTNIISGSTTPKPSTPGTNQFGINLVANDFPAVGNNPEGAFLNAIPAPGYDIPNMYKYVSGDVVAYSPNVSLVRKFTVSYVVNVAESLPAGVYTTTLTYIASGQF